jgi:RHS repeat-associated protein
VDYNGTQYWSGVINVIANEENPVGLPLEQLALNITNNPKPARFDGVPPVRGREEKRLAGLEGLVGILSRTVVGYTPNPKVYYYLNDQLGTPQLMVDSTGTVVWEARYRPFGEAQVHAKSTVANNFRFPGQYYDQETGLHYNYRRDYHPGSGRYVEPDPIGLRGGLNLFAYGGNSPLNFDDPSGLQYQPGPLVPLPTANPEQRAPGAGKPPAGTRQGVPCAAATLNELGRYVRDWWGKPGYDNFTADYDWLAWNKSHEIPCGTTAACDLQFNVEDRVHLYSITCPGDREPLLPSLQSVSVQIIGACCHGASESPSGLGPFLRPMY